MVESHPDKWRYTGREAVTRRYFKIVKDSASDGNCFVADDIIIGKPDTPGSGIYSLDEMDIFNMLSIPPYNRDNTTSKDVYTKALEYCEARRAMLIVDPPNNWTATIHDVDNEFKNILSANAAIFFPHIKAPDPYS